MGYTVFSQMDEDGAQAAGLSLPEAFARMMALARCDYAFGRFNGDMVLTLAPSDAMDGFLTEPPPECRSKQLDYDKARTEIMRRFLKHGMGGYRIVPDEEWQYEDRKRCEQNGHRPARRVEFE